MLSATGVWTYTLNNSNAAVEALHAGDTLTDSFTALTADGTAQVVTITLDGADDAAVITGETTGIVTEAGGVNNGTPGTPTATGDLHSIDADDPNDTWQVVSGRHRSTYGTFTIDAAGVWTYTLDDNNTAVQALNVGQSLTDTFTATTVDGTQQPVTITIAGGNDAAVISGDFTGTVVEAGGRRHAWCADRDRRPPLHRPPTIRTTVGRRSARHRPPAATAATTLTAAGVWTYTLDDNNTAVQALNAGRR